MRLVTIHRGRIVALALAFLALALLARSEHEQAVKPVTTAKQTTYTYYFPLISTTKIGALKGIALVGSCDDAKSVGANWEYAWYPLPQDCAGMENVPMIRDADQLAKISQTGLGGNSRWIMGFNEPDLCDQACLTPDQAVPLWAQIEEKFPNQKLVAPVPSQFDPEWLLRFRSAFIAQYGRAPRFDALAAHCYFWLASDCITVLTNQYKRWASEWGVPEVWLTEFGFWTSDTRTLRDTSREVTALVNWMKADPLVTRYAWFTARSMITEPWFSNGAWNGPANLLDHETGLPSYFGILYKGY